MENGGPQEPIVSTQISTVAPFAQAGFPLTRHVYPSQIYAAVTSQPHSINYLDPMHLLTPTLSFPSLSSSILPHLQQPRDVGPVFSFSNSTQRNSMALLNLVQKIQKQISGAQSDQNFDTHEVKLLKEISTSLLPNTITVPVCQDWDNFIQSFNGHVKVTLNPNLKTNKFKFEFFQQVAYYYYIKNFLENKNRQEARPEDEVNLNASCSTDRMDIIISSIIGVLKDNFNIRYDEMEEQNVEIKKELELSQKQVAQLKSAAGYGYLYPVIDASILSRKRPSAVMDEDSRTLYKVIFIGTFDVPVSTGDILTHGDQIFAKMTLLKESLKGECVTTPAAISLNEDDVALHITKTPRISFTKLVCVCVDGMDKNYFCIGYGIASEAILKIFVFCTNIQSCTTEIVQSLHKRTVARRPPASSQPLMHVQRFS